MKTIHLLTLMLIGGALYIYVSQNHSADTVEVNDAPPSTSIALPLSEAAKGARVYFVEPMDGSTVTSPVKIVFGLDVMTVAPAGMDEPFSGHHHLLINMDELPDMTQPLPATDSLIHFGKGQTETLIDLPTGTHELQLVLGNYLHIPHSEPVVSEKITITVE